MQAYQNTIIDTAGNAVPGVTVTVYNAGTLVLAAIYSDNNRTVLSNPFTNTVDGSFKFYAVPGRYDVVLSKSGFSAAAVDTSDIVLYDGPSLKLINVRDYGAKGDGVTDDSAAIQTAIATGGALIYFPPGTYIMSSGLTLSTAQTLIGAGYPGSAVNGLATVLKHTFNGDFITFTGTNGSNDSGSGGGLKNLQLLQSHGNGTGASGVAVKITAGSAAFFPSRVRIEACQIETSSGANSWSYGIDADGLLDTTHGITDLYVSQCRIVGDTNSTASIRLQNGRNVHLFECQLTGVNGHLIVTGGAGVGQQSSAVHISNISGLTLSLDQATLVTCVGGGWTNLTLTANTTNSSLFPGYLTNAPTLVGTNITIGSLMVNANEWRLLTSGNSTIGVDTANRVRIASAGANILWGTAPVALGGGAAATLGTIGGSGPAVAGQNEWLKVIDSNGNTRWLPVWA